MKYDHEFQIWYEANERLFAAAPDLLAACERYLRQYALVHDGKIIARTPLLIHAAVAKAKGDDK